MPYWAAVRGHTSRRAAASDVGWRLLVRVPSRWQNLRNILARMLQINTIQ